MKQESRPVFVTDDGEVFANEDDALAHEAKEREKERALAALKVRSVIHGFDDTEGRGYFAKTLIVTDARAPELIQWCLDKFGPPLVPWYGGGFYSAWVLDNTTDGLTVDWALKHDGHKPRYGHSPWELAVVSVKDYTWAGLPMSEFPWPRPAPKKSN